VVAGSNIVIPIVDYQWVMLFGGTLLVIIAGTLLGISDKRVIRLISGAAKGMVHAEAQPWRERGIISLFRRIFWPFVRNLNILALAKSTTLKCDHTHNKYGFR